MYLIIRSISILALVASITLTGCASRVPQGITQASIAHAHPVPVTVKATTAGYSELLKDEEFQRAITDSIQSTKVFTGVSKDANVSIKVVLEAWQSDSFGIGMDGKSITFWTVTANGKLFEKLIVGKASKGFTDAFMAENRTRIAARAALEDGIRVGLEWVGTLEFMGP